MLKVLAQSAAKAPVASAELEKVDAAVAFYEQKVRPELLASKIVPVLLAIGEKLPFIGHPATLPIR
jgi:dienelactone hydrolase